MAGLQKHIAGKYEVLERLETDAAGDVYRVRHLFLDELRLVRVINPHLAMTPEIGEGFLQEARNATRLRHPNIAQLHDFVLEDDGSAVIISELVEGPTLAEALGELGPLPPRLALEAAQQALRGLGYLHRAGLLHRDISLDKLRLSRDVDGQVLVKWMDLGIAKVLDAGEGLPISGMFPARPRYASPERFGSSGADGGPALDARSDLYSFGIVLYELLTGRCPVPGHDAFSFMAGHLSAPPLDFAESDPEGKLPAELRAILLQTLAKKPDERFQTAEDLARRLAAVQIQLPADGGDAYFNRALGMARKRNEATRRLRIDDAFKTAVVPMVPPAAPAKPASPPATVAPPDQDWEKTRPLSRNPGSASAETLATAPVLRPPSSPAAQGGTWADRPLTTAEPLPRLEPEPRAPERVEPPRPPVAPVPVPAPVPAVVSASAGGAAPPATVAGEPARRSQAPLLAAAAVLALVGVAAGWFLFRPSPGETAAKAAQEPIAETVEVSEAPAETPQIVEEASPQPATSVAATQPPVQEQAAVAPPPVAPERRVVVPPPPVAPSSRTVVEVRPNATAPSGPMRRGDFITGSGPGVEQVEPGPMVTPAYPDAARGTGRSAHVTVSILVDENGNVLQARVKEGDSSRLGFNEAAVAAARRMRFLPATRDGIPGKAWTELAFEFSPPPAPAAPQEAPAPTPAPVAEPQATPEPPPAEIPPPPDPPPGMP